MNEYWAFLLVFFGALLICLGGSYFMDGRLRKRMDEKMRVRLTEARDNRLVEQHLGWGDGFDVEPHSTPNQQDDDCEGCDDDE